MLKQDGKKYSMYYKCYNCYSGFLVYISFGQEALDSLECPICGMNEVYKTEKQIETCGICLLENERLIWKSS